MSATTLPEVVIRDEEPLIEEVDGRTVELPPLGVKSSLLAFAIAASIRDWVGLHGLGTAAVETMFVLDKKLKRRPDVAFVSAERWPLDRDIPEVGDWEVVPDLAVEVFSPNDDAEDLARKVVEYFDHGVREVWLAMPRAKQVHVYESRDRSRVVVPPAELETALLPGWRLPLATLFRGSPRG